MVDDGSLHTPDGRPPQPPSPGAQPGPPYPQPTAPAYVAPQYPSPYAPQTMPGAPQAGRPAHYPPAGPQPPNYAAPQANYPPPPYQHQQPTYPAPPYPQQQPPYAPTGYPQPSYPQPSYPQPSYPQPSYPQANYPQPSYPQPAYAPQPVPVQAVPVQPVAVQPVSVQPAAVSSVAAQPVAAQAVAAAPAQPAGNRPLAVGSSAAAAVRRPILATSPTMPRAEQPDEDAQPELAAYFKNSPPWLVSAVIHMVLLIVLGLMVFAVQMKPNLVIEATILAEDLGEQLEDQTFSTSKEETDALKDIITPDNLPEVMDPFAAPPNTEIAIDPNQSLSKIEAPVVGLALSGREAGMKQALLAAYGGTEQTESAVHLGLTWLARNQQQDGSWSLMGPYAGGAVSENRAAATAMALLAFQGAGHTHLGGKDAAFSQVVSRGWNYLLKQQDPDGSFFRTGPANHRLYTHAQCTIAVCELLGMTKDQKFKKPAEKAVEYALRVQDQELGGWRYIPGQGSDTSVTGWFVMALQSARMAYLPVPEQALNRVRGYLDKAQVNGGIQYLYQPDSHGGMAMDAEGLLCRQYLGWKRDDQRLTGGSQLLVQDPINWNRRDAYYWYYATQVCHHMEGDVWRQWNRAMKQVLPENQTKTGAERGSWDPDGDQWGGHGGRLYVTCLHIFMLEVYYRHLPIYQYEAFTGDGKGGAGL